MKCNSLTVMVCNCMLVLGVLYKPYFDVCSRELLIFIVVELFPPRSKICALVSP